MTNKPNVNVQSPHTATSTWSLRKVVMIVAGLNLAYCGVEFAVALAIGSVSLFADSIDFLEDASVNLLIAIALAGILLVPGLATLWTAWEKFLVPLPPAPLPLSMAGGGALAINLLCAFMLVQFRAHSGSLTRAFLSARKDALANVAIIAAGVVTAYTRSAWHDLIIGLGIAEIYADAEREVWNAAREEHKVTVMREAKEWMSSLVLNR